MMFARFFKGVVRGGQFNGVREQQLLSTAHCAVEPRERTFIQDALMRNVLVNNHHPSLDLRENILVVHLPDTHPAGHKRHA